MEEPRTGPISPDQSCRKSPLRADFGKLPAMLDVGDYLAKNRSRTVDDGRVQSRESSSVQADSALPRTRPNCENRELWQLFRAHAILHPRCGKRPALEPETTGSDSSDLVRHRFTPSSGVPTRRAKIPLVGVWDPASGGRRYLFPFRCPLRNRDHERRQEET